VNGFTEGCGQKRTSNKRKKVESSGGLKRAYQGLGKAKPGVRNDKKI
jgi:hypothetical protein